MNRLLTIVLVMFWFLTVLNSQEVNVTAAFDTTKILSGDQIWFTVTINMPEHVDLNLSRFTDTLIAEIEILRGPLSDTSHISDDLIQITDRYLITSFDSGRHEVPPVYAELASEEGLRRFYSEYSYLVVARPDIAPADSAQMFFDIVGPYRAPLTPGEILPWILVASAIIVIMYYLYKYLKSRKRKQYIIAETLFAEAAHIIAYRRLEKLKSEKLWQKELYKQYFSALSDIIRSYIDNRFGMNSMESTTREILTDLKKVDLSGTEALDALQQLLELSDMVKFAKLIPDATDCELCMEHAWSFVSLTRKEKEGVESVDKDTIGVKGGDSA